MQPLVFIPPSESKAKGGEPSFLSGHGRFRDLASRRDRVLAGLEKAMRGKVADREAVLKAKGDALAEATETNLAVRKAAVTMPAVERYTGVLYEHLGWGTLPETARRTLADHVVVVDGLYGLLAPTDEIPDYDLPMDATLPDVGKLADFWREPLGLELQDFVGKREMWDLLPDAHRRALPKGFPFALSVDFVEIVGGKPRTASHANKALKGALLRHLATNGFRRDVLVAFQHDGFQLDKERSTDASIVFSRVVEARDVASATPGRRRAEGASSATPATAKRPASKKAPAKRPAGKKTANKPAKKAAKKSSKAAKKRRT